ncbi:haloacid dehalogenase type II [Pseudidiomarina homiensis]|uniref:haloacid dehalogenase type II n=1 Tax=Pseudidiomarina homiensis TaxID=364198 RepID=UPI00215A2F8A|nr:haloacid dehalogenase type II [Pseudidiomarina homiensis]
MTTLAFDVYGTLIDTHGVVRLLTTFLGEAHAPIFSQRWRDKQLEYSFRQGLMRDYQGFKFCTTAALAYTAAEFERKYSLGLSNAQQTALIEHYSQLPAFNDVRESLLRLKNSGHRCYAFSNGSHEAVSELLKNAKIFDLFDDIVSCEEVQSYKPNPDVYHHFTKKTSAEGKGTWLISSNSFDIIGAAAVGWNTAWLQRTDDALFDPWDIEPTQIIASLDKLKL